MKLQPIALLAFSLCSCMARMTNMASSLVIDGSLSRDFGTLNVGASANRSFTFTNSGNENASSVTVHVDAPFQIVSESCSAGLVSGSSCVVTVQFQVSHGGIIQGYLSLTANYGGVSVTTKERLTGTGTMMCAWMTGENLLHMINVANPYGTQGQPSSIYSPGARQMPVTWIDSAGNLWLFGGLGTDSNAQLGYFNDLWKFDGAQWTWVAGSDTINSAGSYGSLNTPDPSNQPSARYGGVGWVDSSGNLMLFGGTLNNTFFYNDLWKFDGTNWTWVGGTNLSNQSGVYGTQGVASASNVPGGRWMAASAIDSHGNFWLFGGEGYASTGGMLLLNDLWKFDGTNWTWVSGANTGGAAASFGPLGAPSPAYVPAAKRGANLWVDDSGASWVFAGVEPTGNFMNDLWKFDGTNWTWVAGSSSGNQNGNYGTLYVAAPTNTPGARFTSASWTDTSNQLWLFAGRAYDGTGTWGPVNDLWKFDGTSWTWMGGSATASPLGIYGTKGVADPTNRPGGRSVDGSVAYDGKGNFWVFGGFQEIDSVGTVDPFGYALAGDFWKCAY